MFFSNTVGVATQDGEVSKENHIQFLKNKGCKVAMVGDAANDAPAIAYSDLGIAIKSSIGDRITEKYAGIVVQQGLLSPISTAFDVAKKTKRNIFQNLFISLTYNSLITLVGSGLFIGLGFALNPIVGVALMVLESAIVLSNVYSFKKQAVLSPALDNSNEIINEKYLDDATSKILNSLDYQKQPNEILVENLADTKEDDAFFTPNPSLDDPAYIHQAECPEEYESNEISNDLKITY